VPFSLFVVNMALDDDEMESSRDGCLCFLCNYIRSEMGSGGFRGCHGDGFRGD